jgi:thiol-disulfide isomerase/thioredoxin
MKNRLSNFITVYNAELLKKKKKGIFWTSVIIGLVFPLLAFLNYFLNGFSQQVTGLPYNFFTWFIGNSIMGYAGFFFPLLIIISASRITQLDHKNGGWKLLETSPLSRSSVFFGKFALLLTSNLISIVTFVIFGVLFSFILISKGNIPEEAMTSFPLSFVTQLVFRLFISSLLISAIQYSLSVLFKGMIWPLLIGLTGLIFSLFARAVFMTNTSWNPFQILTNVGTSTYRNETVDFLVYTDLISLFLSIPILYISFEWYKFRTIRGAFMSSTLKMVKLFVVVCLSGFGLAYLLSPNQSKTYEKTILAGEIESDTPIAFVYLIDNVLGDTIVKAPVKNNKFHTELSNPLILDYYMFVIDNKMQESIFLGEKDSLYVKVRFYKQKGEVKVKGTRLAENQIVIKTNNRQPIIEWILEDDKNIENAASFTSSFIREWEDSRAQQSNYRTIDNFIPKEDFKNRNKKVLAIRYLNYWNEFKNKRKALFPDKETADVDEITELKSLITLEDETLLSISAYRKYLNKELSSKIEENLEPNIKILEAYKTIEKGTFRDKANYIQIIKSLNESSDDTERASIIEKYLPEISEKKYRATIMALNKDLERLSRGNKAPELLAYNVKDEDYNLSSFNGKFILIDVWASWCGPCKRESPFFEKYAIKYKDQNISFISLNIDRDEIKWKSIIQNTKSESQQLRAKEIDLFNSQYSIKSIPRFIFIDTLGNIINKNMPPPSSSAFELLLTNELKEVEL